MQIKARILDLRIWIISLFFNIVTLLTLSEDNYGQINLNNNHLFHNSITIETLGHNRGLISVNYEYIVKTHYEWLYLTSRTGIGYTPGINIGSKKLKGSVYIPIVLTTLFGKKPNFVQLGIGYTSAFGDNYIDYSTTPPTTYQKYESAYILSLGYRYMDKKGFIAQIYPLFQWTNNPSSKFSIGFGLAFGGRF